MLFVACAPRENQQAVRADTVQTAPVEEKVRPAENGVSFGEPAEEEVYDTTMRYFALKALDSLERSIVEAGFIPSYMQPLTHRLLDVSMPQEGDSVLVLILKSFEYPFDGTWGEGEENTYRLSIMRARNDTLTLITHEDFTSGGGNIKAELSFQLSELSPQRYAIHVLTRHSGFNGTGTSDRSTSSLYAMNGPELVEIFSLTVSELFEGPTDGSGSEETVKYFFEPLSTTNAPYDILVTKPEDGRTGPATRTIYQWNGKSYAQRE